MRRRSWARLLAVPAVAIGITAGVTVAAPAAFAQTDTSGTVAVTLPLSYIAQLAKAGVVVVPVPLSELSVNKSNQTVTITFTVTGGDGDVSTFFGQVDLSGKLYFASASHHKIHVASVGGLDLNLVNGDIEGTPKGTSTPVGLLDLNGNVAFSFTQNTDGTYSDTYSASDLTVDPAGAAYLDSALHTSAFVANADTGGSMAASWIFNPTS
jgi:hypothetical protein